MRCCSRLVVSSFAFLLSAYAQAEISKWNLNSLPLEIISKDAQQQTTIETAVNPVVQKINAMADEVKQLNQQGELKNPSALLLELLALCDQWQLKTSAKFSCRLGGLQKDWQAAAVSGELPDRAALRQKARRHLQLQWTADQQRVRFSDQAKTEGLQLDLQGLWQGWVIEQLTSVIKVQDAVLLNYGNVRTGIGNGNNSELIRLLFSCQKEMR
jgi:thiamine biosynthesis lipoprotein ApbE